MPCYSAYEHGYTTITTTPCCVGVVIPPLPPPHAVWVWLYHHYHHPMLCGCGYTTMPNTPCWNQLRYYVYSLVHLPHYLQVSLVILAMTVAAGFVCWKYKHFIKRKLLSLRKQLHEAYHRGMSQYGRIRERLGQNTKIHPE